MRIGRSIWAILNALGHWKGAHLNPPSELTNSITKKEPSLFSWGMRACTLQLGILEGVALGSDGWSSWKVLLNRRKVVGPQKKTLGLKSRCSSQFKQNFFYDYLFYYFQFNLNKALVFYFENFIFDKHVLVLILHESS
jgi:hypothetical protein